MSAKECGVQHEVVLFRLLEKAIFEIVVVVVAVVVVVVVVVVAAAAVVVVVVFALNRSFYPTTSTAVHPVPVLVLHPRATQIRWPQTVKNQKTKVANESR